MTIHELYAALDGQRGHRQFTADRLAAELGCEVTPHPTLSESYEARDPLPGVWLLTGTPEEIRAEVRAEAARIRPAASGPA